MSTWKPVWALACVTFKGGIRDRLLQGLVLIGLFFLFSMGIFSSFSMRQPLEVAINFGLSIVQILVTVMTIVLGLTLISREIESRASYAILTQPASRGSYVLGKFFGLLALSFLAVLSLGICAGLGIWLTGIGLHEQAAISWLNIAISLLGSFLCCSILAAVTLLFTTLATSAILPFLLTFSVYVIGQSTQAVRHYIESGMSGQEISPLFKMLVMGAYYIFPNLAAFDFKAQAIYNLPPPILLLGYAFLYSAAYTAIVLLGAIILFNRRDMP